jgi:D-lyxose ketol-isomerase
MIADENQVTPRHYHYSKMEDIINRGGGNLVVELYHKDEEEATGQLLAVKIDGVLLQVKTGEQIILEPGQSICLPPYLGHKFYGEQGKGKVLIGEVSAVNDDQNDNHFFDGVGRFPAITEDEKKQFLLISDYL